MRNGQCLEITEDNARIFGVFIDNDKDGIYRSDKGANYLFFNAEMKKRSKHESD